MGTGQAARLRLTGVLSGNVTILQPSGIPGRWIVENNTTGSFSVNFLTTAGGSTGITVPQGFTQLVHTDGTNFYSSTSAYLLLSGGTITGAVAMTSNGLNVGSGQLQVTGGNVTTSGSITATGDITAFSDAKWKEDVKTIEKALDKVKLMRGVTFLFKEEATKRRHAGVIAQEMIEVFPEVVTIGNGSMQDDSLYVAYGNLCAVLIEAIKELAVRLDNVELVQSLRAALPSSDPQI